MKSSIQRIEKQLNSEINQKGKAIIFSLAVGIIVYFLLMALDLVNDIDGIWHPSNFIAGDWEISLGRGLQRYADRARFGIVSTAFNSVITLFLISVSNVYIVDTLKIKNRVYKYTALILLIANPIVCCSLTYSYMSVNFALAYFFSVCAVLVIIKDTVKKWEWIGCVLFSGLLLAVSMAFYQAYICVTAVILLLFFIKQIIACEITKKLCVYAVKVLGFFVTGGVFYLIITKLLLFRAGVQMSGYRGASSVSVTSMITNLPTSVTECYKQYKAYICQAKMFSNLEFIDIVLVYLAIVYAVVVVYQFVKLFKKKKMFSIIFLIMIALVPIAACIILLIAVGNSMSTLMSAGMLMSIVLLGSIISEESFWIKRACYLGLVVLAWFQLSMVVNDQLALREGKDATITLSENIVHELFEDGYYEEGLPIALVGRPGNNPAFVKSGAYQMANGYARFGCWSTDARNNKYSWDGVMRNFLGVSLNICNEIDYEKLIQNEEIEEMPVFPMEGSIRVIDGYVVVKVSNLY